MVSWEREEITPMVIQHQRLIKEASKRIVSLMGFYRQKCFQTDLHNHSNVPLTQSTQGRLVGLQSCLDNDQVWEGKIDISQETDGESVNYVFFFKKKGSSAHLVRKLGRRDSLNHLAINKTKKLLLHFPSCCIYPRIALKRTDWTLYLLPWSCPVCGTKFISCEEARS